MKKDIVLVLGASGFVGKHLCKHLINKGYAVRAFDRCNTFELDECGDIEFVFGEYNQIDEYGYIFEGVFWVIDLICTSIPMEGTSQILNELDENIRPLVLLLEKMKNYNINNMIFLSSAGTIYGNSGNVYNNSKSNPNPMSSYGLVKEVSESYIKFYDRYYDKNYIIARVSNLYGLGQNIKRKQGIIPIFIDAILNNKEITIYGDGENIRNYIYIDDLLDAIIALMEYEGDKRVFNIASGEHYSINEIIGLIEKHTNMTFIRINKIKERRCDVNCNYIDIDECKEELKWQAKYKVEDGIRKMLDWLSRKDV